MAAYETRYQLLMVVVKFTAGFPTFPVKAILGRGC